jgi:RNA 3'-terminal phosphate cyclase (ATP)
MSLTYDYADQVLFPSLEDTFGIKIERRLTKRGWSVGPTFRGLATFKIYPLGIGEALSLKYPEKRFQNPQDFVVSTIDASIIVPESLHGEFEAAIRRDLDVLFPGVPVKTRILEDSNHESRVYILLVAISYSKLRWGHDILYAIPKPKKGKSSKSKAPVSISEHVSHKVTKGLFEEVSNMSTVDSHLQDQMVIYQAIARGLTSFTRRLEPVNDLQEMLRGLHLEDPSQMRKERTDKPFGEGSLHTQTARWVAAEMLGSIVYYHKGQVVEGAGICFNSSSSS